MEGCSSRSLYLWSSEMAFSTSVLEGTVAKTVSWSITAAGLPFFPETILLKHFELSVKKSRKDEGRRWWNCGDGLY